MYLKFVILFLNSIVLTRVESHKTELLGRAIKKPSTVHLWEMPQWESQMSIPTEFNWCSNGYCVSSSNQHIPQYCGSCWNFASVMALNDRVKGLRKGAYPDIKFSTQHVLNCIKGASCYGGQVDSVYNWMLNDDIALSFEDAMPYLACSSDSTEGFCKNVDTTCKPLNIARTCGSFSSEAGPCVGLQYYPNVTISDYGTISGQASMKAEISKNGPIACSIAATALLNYKGGIITNADTEIDHVVEVVGWSDTGKYWIIRNSWGSYWGEMSFARISYGSLALEEECTWATIKDYTAPEKHNQVPCTEGGKCSL